MDPPNNLEYNERSRGFTVKAIQTPPEHLNVKVVQGPSYDEDDPGPWCELNSYLVSDFIRPRSKQKDLIVFSLVLRQHSNMVLVSYVPDKTGSLCFYRIISPRVSVLNFYISGESRSIEFF